MAPSNCKRKQTATSAHEASIKAHRGENRPWNSKTVNLSDVAISRCVEVLQLLERRKACAASERGKLNVDKGTKQPELKDELRRMLAAHIDLPPKFKQYLLDETRSKTWVSRCNRDLYNWVNKVKCDAINLHRALKSGCGQTGSRPWTHWSTEEWKKYAPSVTGRMTESLYEELGNCGVFDDVDKNAHQSHPALDCTDENVQVIADRCSQSTELSVDDAPAMVRAATRHLPELTRPRAGPPVDPPPPAAQPSVTAGPRSHTPSEIVKGDGGPSMSAFEVPVSAQAADKNPSAALLARIGRAYENQCRSTEQHSRQRDVSLNLTRSMVAVLQQFVSDQECMNTCMVMFLNCMSQVMHMMAQQASGAHGSMQTSQQMPHVIGMHRSMPQSQEPPAQAPINFSLNPAAHPGPSQTQAPVRENVNASEQRLHVSDMNIPPPTGFFEHDDF